MDKQPPTQGMQTFEELKRSNEHGAEYWSARDLQSTLGYSQWRRFEDAIKRAMTSCEASGNDSAHHFAGAGKMIEVGKGAATLAEKLAVQKEQRDLEGNRDRKRRELFQRQDEIQTRRDSLIDELEEQLSQKLTVTPLFACEWEVS